MCQVYNAESIGSCVVENIMEKRDRLQGAFAEEEEGLGAKAEVENIVFSRREHICLN